MASPCSELANDKGSDVRPVDSFPVITDVAKLKSGSPSLQSEAQPRAAVLATPLKDCTFQMVDHGGRKTEVAAVGDSVNGLVPVCFWSTTSSSSGRLNVCLSSQLFGELDTPFPVDAAMASTTSE